MGNRIFYACQGITVNPRNPSGEFYLNGVQSFGTDYNFGTTVLPDIGRSQKKDTLYNPISGTINLERFVSNYTTQTDRCLGPFLHRILCYGGSPSFSQSNGPSTYRSKYLPKIWGNCITGNTSSDIREFDIKLILQKDNSTLLNSTPANQIVALNFTKALLTNISYSISVTGGLREGLGFQSKNIVLADSTYTKTQISMPGTNGGQYSKLIRAVDLKNTLSSIPSDLNSIVTGDGLIVDGSSVYGITDISTELQLSYNKIIDEGRWLGCDDTNNNLWTTLLFPLVINTTFTINARRSFGDSILNTPNEFTKQKIKLVFECKNYDNTSGNYFIIDLGSSNYLSSFSENGGNTDGSIVSYTLTYQNSTNDFSTYFTTTPSSTVSDQTTERY